MFRVDGPPATVDTLIVIGWWFCWLLFDLSRVMSVSEGGTLKRKFGVNSISRIGGPWLVCLNVDSLPARAADVPVVWI